MAGRKKLHEPESLKVGERIQLKGDRKNFANQYAYNWAKRINKANKIKGKTVDFKKVISDNKVFIERVS